MSRRATQRSRSCNAPSRASTSVASQHAATFQSPIGGSPPTPRGSRARSVSQPAAELSNELQDEVLQWTYQSFMDLMKALHQKSTHARPSLDRSRIQQMQRNTLSSTMNTLHRAYQKLLREGVETGSTETHSRDDLAAAVRDLADAIKHKFLTNRPENAAEAQRQLEDMLQNLMEELVWRRVADVLREATSQALENAERAYERSQVCRRELTSLRHAVP